MHHQVDRAPVHALTALSVLVLDWVAFGLTIIGSPEAYGSVVLSSALVTALCAVASERWASGQRLKDSVLTGLFAAVVVAVPLPMLGTVLSTVVIAYNLALQERKAAARVR